ncbi:hypothetical protein KIH87_11750 [Paraneptunicella aestuarii]|uniref:hypothetical protein n=1 Tax=Paraneptunicella aestuarii TaxID=2831148 RepID=UPI001E2F73AE|nr:hypothetical protein [Paraneptunicella aestuarii]UAA37388.1 hypothetical protein KIH87_11750 [Paraneptunicella aestuarii]
MLTSSNVLAIIVACFIGYVAYRGVRFIVSSYAVLPPDDELAKDLLLKRHAMVNGNKQVFNSEEDDYFAWLERAKIYLERSKAQ